MRTNKIVWALMGVLLFGVVVVFINRSNKPEEAPALPGTGDPVATGNTKPTVRPNSKVKVVEVTGDTVSESLKDVQKRYEVERNARLELEKTLKEVSERQGNIEKRVGADAKGDDRVNAVASTVDQIKETVGDLAGQFSTQEKRLNTTKANGYAFSNDDLGIGNAKADGKDHPQAQVTLMEGYVAVRPLSASSNVGSSGLKPGVSTAMDNAEKLGLAPRGNIEQHGKDVTLTDGKKKSVTTPHFTIPARATIMDAVAMTAMIGRVPVGGRVQDPFPVKFIIGDDNLATNGLSIPGLQGIVAEGIATGNWNLSCVSVQLTGATFTFADGRVQHLPNTDKNEFEGRPEGQMETNPMASAEGKSRGASGDPIGYISNPQGVPCIGGVRVTDAPQQLAQMGLLGMAKSYFDAKANAETTNTVNPLGGSNSTVTGDQVKFANNATAAGAMQTVIDFYRTHTRDSFDAIVVNPGEKVSLHITRDLYVDYNTGSRKLVYTQGNKNGSRKMD